MAKVRVTMRAASWGIEAGQQVDVEQEVADQLVADGHADRSADLRQHPVQARKPD